MRAHSRSLPAAGATPGDEYDAQLARRPADRRARTSFRQLALTVVSPGGSVLEFGAGTGLDACWYAQHGLEVQAYEPDPDMCTAFECRCRQWLECGRVTLERGPYPEFLARARADARAAALVTANFAPLNLIAELPSLFACLHARSARGGKLLVSVLNPWYPGDLRYPWWWRNLGRLVWLGRYAVSGARGPIVRRRVAVYARECEPHFALRSIFPDQPGAGGRIAFARSRYLFLLFERRDGTSADERAAAAPLSATA